MESQQLEVELDRIAGLIDDQHRLLLRYHGGETKAWSVVRVPSAEMEDLRQLHRELATLKRERTRGRNRIRGLLATQGVGLRRWTAVREELGRLRVYDGSELRAGVRARLERELERLELIAGQIRTLETARDGRRRRIGAHHQVP